MRKEQEKIINKAKKQKLPEEEIEYLKNAKYSVNNNSNRCSIKFRGIR